MALPTPIRRLPAILLALSATAAWALDCPARIRMAYMDAPAEPFFLGRGTVGEPPGLFVDWALQALAATGCNSRVELARLPVARLDKALSEGDLDIVLGVASTSEREQTQAFPGRHGKRLLYVARADIALYTALGDRLVWSGQTRELKGYKVGVARAQMPANLAASQGWALELAPDNASNFRKLESGRVQVLLETSILADPYFQAHPLPGIRKLNPPLATLEYYAPASRSFQRDFPAFTEQFWLQLCRQSRTVLRELPACNAG
ncbi:transporter substrate-binding domain-containing protein [Chitinimonas sp.]|uniref:substrate-binding periplasmic protein n=1 Tax=Chitinimonas sp. TaxID=1934313 RepID=UPI002F91E711